MFGSGRLRTVHLVGRLSRGPFIARPQKAEMPAIAGPAAIRPQQEESQGQVIEPEARRAHIAAAAPRTAPGAGQVDEVRHCCQLTAPRPPWASMFRKSRRKSKWCGVAKALLLRRSKVSHIVGLRCRSADAAGLLCRHRERLWLSSGILHGEVGAVPAFHRGFGVVGRGQGLFGANRGHPLIHRLLVGLL